MARLAASLALALALLAPAAAHAQPAKVKAGVAVLDGTYHVGSSAGQYASTRDGGYGDVDPHAQQVKNQGSYGVQSRESIRALVVRGADGRYVALLSDDHYIPQDALFRRTAQLASEKTGGAIDETNMTMAVTHNHSSPSYSSLSWGVWTFQDAFDFRFFAYYAERNAEAIARAYRNLHDVRLSATASYFDKFQKNPMGPGRADDGTPAGFPRSYTDHDLSVVRLENVDDPRRPEPLATIVNIGQHPEFLNGYDLISSEYVGAMERMVDRTLGGVTIFTQNATGTSEVEEEFSHPVEEREAFNHTQYNQMEWGAHQLADAVIADVRTQIDRQLPNPDDAPRPYGGSSYRDRFVRWRSRFPVAMADVWFPGPVSHPYPGVSSCRTDPALAGNPRLPVVGLPDCEQVPAGSSLSPVLGSLPLASPGVDTDTFEALGIPVPENYSFPSTGALEDTVGLHLQAFRLGEVLFTICPCEQWVDQSYNIKTRLDRLAGNEWLGYDPTAPDADPANRCTPNGDGSHRPDGSGTGTWTCSTGGDAIPDRLIQRMRSRIANDAAGWDDPKCAELGCGAQAESEPTDLTKIRGNYTHDDTRVRGGVAQSGSEARRLGYKLVVTVSMANDYNGYIATYRDFQSRDHYRKALTGWGPHSSDYLATRLVRLGRALKGDGASQRAVARESDPTAAAPEYAPLVAKQLADHAAQDAKVRAVGEASTRAAAAYEATLPDDGGPPAAVVQPKDIERFDAATFTWVGGNNYSDLPEVVVQRRAADGRWVDFADQSGEVPLALAYPAGYAGNDADAPGRLATGLAGYRAGGQQWRWTATFEAMVNRFELVDPQGDVYRATPAGSYRFVVDGRWHSGGADVPYHVVSREFEVRPWSGITVEDAALDAQRRVTFAAGPSSSVTEQRIRGTSTRDFGPLAFTIGPVDFPDHASDQAATGFRFLDRRRGYSTVADAGGAPDLDRAQHYCLDCRFRDWLDATGQLTATVTFSAPGSPEVVEELATTDGRFRTARELAPGETATIVVRDAWGDLSGRPATLTG